MLVSLQPMFACNIDMYPSYILFTSSITYMHVNVVKGSVQTDLNGERTQLENKLLVPVTNFDLYRLK